MFSESVDDEDSGKDEEGPSRRKRRRNKSLQPRQEENQATAAPWVTVHLHMVVELAELWRYSGAGAC